MESVLFIPLGFYSYDDKIEEEMVKQGYEVTRFTPLGKYTIIDKIMNSLTGGRHAEKKSLRRQRKYFSGNKKQFDYVFVIVGKELEPGMFGEFKKSQPHAKFILYLWDDISRVKWYEENKRYYEEIYSFDIKNVEDAEIKYLPLFYTDMHEYRGEKKEYLLNMFGELHSDRIEIWDKIVKQCRLVPKQCFLYLIATTASQFFQTLFPSDNRWMNMRYVHVKKTKFETVTNVMKRSRVALDIQYASQTGLTIRTIESLAAHTKLITTNEYVKKYDFYKYGNICVVDRESPVIPNGFFETEYQDVPVEVVQKYSLSHWVKTMLKKEL